MSKFVMKKLAPLLLLLTTSTLARSVSASGLPVLVPFTC